MPEFDPAHAAKHGYTKADWDDADSPELTDEELSLARPLSEACPELAAKIGAEIKRRGRPALDNPKQAVSIRLDADLVKALKDSGKGWQSRANEMLRAAVGM